MVCDTLRADRLGCYGGPVPTPNIDALAERGVRFTDHRAQGGYTLPSMVSLMSGLWIAEHSDALPVAQPTLAESLREGGFATAAFVANPVCSPGRGFARGFEHFEATDGMTQSSDALAERFDAWLGERDHEDERPWFAWVHAMDPHEPYAPAAAFADMPAQPASDEQVALWHASYERLVARRGLEPRTDISAWFDPMLATRAAYDGEVRTFDAALGRMVDALARHGEDDVLVVLASDHGEMLFETPQYAGDFEAVAAGWQERQGLADLHALGHHDWFHDEVWRTPLVVAGPGFEPGATAVGLSANVDIYPTLLAVAGVAPSAALDGTSLVGRLALEREHVFGFGESATAVRDRAGVQWTAMPAELSGTPAAESAGLLEDEARRGAAGPRDEAARGHIARLEAAIATWRRGIRLVPNDAIAPDEDDVLRELGYVDDDEEKRH